MIAPEPTTDSREFLSGCSPRIPAESEGESRRDGVLGQRGGRRKKAVTAADRGVIMNVYLDEAYERREREGGISTLKDLHAAIMEGAVRRVRPKMMTVLAIMPSLFPIMWALVEGTAAPPKQ